VGCHLQIVTYPLVQDEDSPGDGGMFIPDELRMRQGRKCHMRRLLKVASVLFRLAALAIIAFAYL
jgi:hypothetical protein